MLPAVEWPRSHSPVPGLSHPQTWPESHGARDHGQQEQQVGLPQPGGEVWWSKGGWQAPTDVPLRGTWSQDGSVGLSWLWAS